MAKSHLSRNRRANLKDLINMEREKKWYKKYGQLAERRLNIQRTPLNLYVTSDLINLDNI